MMRRSAALIFTYLKQNEAPAASRRLHNAFARSFKRMMSTSAVSQDDNHHHESEKMVSEGGGSTTSFHEKKEEVNFKKSGVSDANQPSKNEWQETKDSVAETAKDKVNEVKETDTAKEAQAVAGKASEQAKKEVDTSADTLKDTPQKVAETAQGLKEVGIEAAKAVKRDVSHAAEKVGLKSPS